ncbi:hemerythrin HHE cation-binding protein [Malaciobacter halophilus]|uniref:Hemerythrin HHE cation-binding protein n=1 Tax=Malaciobacter halophilus TaxID=197482 RepID=A0A2N1J3E2_9BACT|nr:hemerythrin domain-containing protein [Malaciobacter halophilus]AXH09138.1 hemerythrin HHE cation-binding domain-containing protein [Malaciobacter halophilus]PKI81066.1 hemerythrin HHE cation-binding protein [Malaciobacter halophilus]
MDETIKSFLTQDHRNCDEEFANLENVVASGDWQKAQEAFNEFENELQTHFDMEEKVLFPIFEQNTGMTCGPTQVMRMEHSQMSNVLSQMREDVAKQDKNHFFGLSESLMMLMQQHNMKEEQMLYAMADAHLEEQRSSIIKQMKELKK